MFKQSNDVANGMILADHRGAGQDRLPRGGDFWAEMWRMNSKRKGEDRWELTRSKGWCEPRWDKEMLEISSSSLSLSETCDVGSARDFGQGGKGHSEDKLQRHRTRREIDGKHSTDKRVRQRRARSDCPFTVCWHNHNYKCSSCLWIVSPWISPIFC